MKIVSSRCLYLGDIENNDTGNSGDTEHDISAGLAHRIIMGLLHIKGKSPIYLIINSFGGSDDHARAIIDAIESDDRDIIGIVFGRAESAAAWILQCCDWRVMMPRSSMMLHLGSSTKDSHSEWGDSMFITDVLRRMQAKDHAYPRNKLTKELKKDWYVYPAQAVALGLADEIGGL